ncbi:MAG: choice-of-anchor J domain-containing protein [Ignavibacteria bacterium]|nr:choice-of-anchor J domain-containing protein [Ignavibacteria bacterium]
MIKKWFSFSLIMLITTGVFLGFNFLNYSSYNDDPTGSRNSNSKSFNSQSQSKSQKQNFSEPDQSTGNAYYTDNFDGANDTASLKSRGYKIYYRSGGAQGIAPLWFQGALFPSFNGPANGYVASNFQTVNGNNNIDNWLVLPKKNVSAGDSVIFDARSDLGSTYPDSIRVLYSNAGDSIPEAAWTELGRFKTNTAGQWERKAFGVSSSGANARYAIRYSVVNGGPSGTNSDYIGIDALTLETAALTNDIKSVSINSPSGNLSIPGSLIAPKATFENTGISNQTNIPVTFKITGPVNYTSNKVITGLTSDSTAQVTFDSTFNPVVGNYSIAVYSGLASDGNRLNDTIKSTFSVTNANFGNGAGYFYANSTTGAATAPSQPLYCWKDTTGSISLAVNKVNALPGISTGDLDDGYWKVLLPAGKKVRFFGVNYDTVRIGTNGIIAFQSYVPDAGNWSPPNSGVPGGSVLNAIYPLWFDFDFSNDTASVTSRISYKAAGDQLVITYDRAQVFSGTPGQYVSFQTVIDISAAPAVNSRILFQYADTTGGKTGSAFINLLNNNNLETHLAGFQNNTGTSALTYRFRNTSSVITPGSIFNTPSGSLAVQFGPVAANLNASCQSLNLTSRLQAIQLTRKDTLTVTLRESVAPYPLIESKKIVYDSITGSASVPLSLAQNGSSYYLYISHRNSISTWSAAPVPCTANLMTYNFTTANSQAYGSNMIVVNGKSSFYTGDVNRDKIVDLSDIVAIYNSVSVFETGPYLLNDVNFDKIADLTDLISTYNNLSNFVAEVPPPGALISQENILYEKDYMPKTEKIIDN